MEVEVRVVDGARSCFVALPLHLIQALSRTSASGDLPPVLALDLRAATGARGTGTPSPGTPAVRHRLRLPLASSHRQVPLFLTVRSFLRRADPDSEVISFVRRTAKDLKLPASFVPQMLQSIQVPPLVLSLSVIFLRTDRLLCIGNSAIAQL